MSKLADEAEALLQTNVLGIRAEHRVALREKYGAIAADRMMQDAASRTPIRAVESVVIAGGPPKYTDPADTTLEGAINEFSRNPVFCSPASRGLLKAHWGQAEYKRRLAAALESSGANEMKVTIK